MSDLYLPCFEDTISNNMCLFQVEMNMLEIDSALWIFVLKKLYPAILRDSVMDREPLFLRLPPSLYLLIFLEPSHIANPQTNTTSSATCVSEHEVETGGLQQPLVKILPNDVIQCNACLG